MNASGVKFLSFYLKATIMPVTENEHKLLLRRQYRVAHGVYVVETLDVVYDMEQKASYITVDIGLSNGSDTLSLYTETFRGYLTEEGFTWEGDSGEVNKYYISYVVNKMPQEYADKFKKILSKPKAVQALASSPS